MCGVLVPCVATISTDINGVKVLVRFGCYQHRYEGRGSVVTVWLLSTDSTHSLNYSKTMLLILLLLFHRNLQHLQQTLWYRYYSVNQYTIL